MRAGRGRFGIAGTDTYVSVIQQYAYLGVRHVRFIEPNRNLRAVDPASCSMEVACSFELCVQARERSL